MNGQAIAGNVARTEAGHEFRLDPVLQRSGRNVIAVVATPLSGGRGRGQGGQRSGGNAPVVRIVTLPGQWKRSLFNGLAQVIVQSTQQPGTITLTATSQGLSKAVLTLDAKPANLRPSVRVP